MGLAVCAWALAAGNARAVHTNLPDDWCVDNANADPCVVSATYDDGVTVHDLYVSSTYAPWASAEGAGGAKTVQWSFQPLQASDLTAALGKTFSMTISTSVVPREIDAFGDSMTYTRSGPSSGRYTVTVTGQPVDVQDQNGCTYPPGGPTCSSVAPGAPSAILQGEINDSNATIYHDPSLPPGLVDSFYGMDMYTNIAETGLPPNLIQSNGQNELQIDLADHHFEQNGTTVVHGNFYLRIPETFLATYWGINDPNTLATDGLNASIGAGGGTLAVTVEPGNTGVQVRITGMTFSRRKLKIKLGAVTPRAPTNVKASRTSGTTGKVTFTPAKPRGQKVTGYKLSCKAANGSTVTFKSRSRHSPFSVALLASGQAYSCNLRARSKAGYGLASKKFSIPR